MNKKYLIFILGLMVTQSVWANRLLLENDWSLEEYHKLQNKLEQLRYNKKLAESFQAGDSTNSYDVLKYNMYMDWYNILYYGRGIEPEDKYWDGKITITLKSNVDGLSVVHLDAVDLEIGAVWINKVPIMPPPQILNNILSIPLDLTYNKDDVIMLEIDYRYNKFENIGFCLYYQGDVDVSKPAGKVEENIAYTVNSPEFARYWFPCNDKPGDKVELTMRVKVPYGYSVASNGLLIDVEDVQTETGENHSTFTWADETPIATFLINAVASKFKEYTERFSPNPTASNPDTLEIINFVWEPDLEGNVYGAKKALSRTKQILELFSRIFTDYPFCKYGTAEVYPFIYGAMENQTMTNLSRPLYHITSDPSTLAHEAAHHWFGNLVSSYSWNDIWFKEGGATWSEALWALERYGEESNYLSVVRQKARTYFTYPEIYDVPIYGNSPDMFFKFPYVFLTYEKASWIYHQLHYHIGQEKNFDILKKLFTKYAYKNIDAEKFIQIYKEELTGYPLDFSIDNFFKQWLYGAGHPIYNCQTIRTIENEADSTWNVHITLTQTQAGNNIANVFETPIWIAFLKGNQIIHLEKVLNNQKIQEYTFSNIPNFTACRVDSLRTLSQTPISNIVSIKQTDIDEVFVYPSPAVNQKFVYVNGISSEINPLSDNIISITNIYGTEQKCSITQLNNSIQVDISDLVSGIYLFRYNNNVFKFSVIR